METKTQLLQRIKDTVKASEPAATVILYGSYARGDNHKDSDIDLLVLVDKDTLSFEDETKIQYPLFHIFYDTGIFISPMVMLKKKWENQPLVTPFYENVKREGIVL